MQHQGTILSVLTLGLGGGFAPAQTPPPSYGFEFVTITHAGNRPANPDEAPKFPYFPLGAVAYEYRISRTEVTTGQWVEFCNAYGQWVAPGGWFEMHGRFVFRDPGTGIYSGPADLPAELGWRYAARYCNWLHNGKRPERWAFEDGVYDTSTFTVNPDGSRNDQIARHPGARFWIPTEDEWIKAVYYDPDRNGPGLDGYWLYPNMSDSPPIPGVTTNAGLNTSGMPVGSYPHARSPWGLLDASGGMDEVLETLAYTASRERMTRGSRFGGDPGFVQFRDRIDYTWHPSSHPSVGAIGFRVASLVPAPSGTLAVMMIVLGSLAYRRRSSNEPALCPVPRGRDRPLERAQAS
ncbi:MAG: formylglycine-generating enzyme family protein [Phycisphaerae bacterium]|nr:formylglycine-generating enzyme family protein [Phycisphaerae bacterium]